MSGPGLQNSTDRFNGAVTSLAIKVRCVVASTGNEALTGSGQTINGVVVNNGDRVLLVAQTSPVENGIWCVDDGLNGWTRAPDWDGNRDIQIGTAILVGVNGLTDTLYQVTAPAGDVMVGIDAVTIVENPLGGLTAPIVLADNEEIQFGDLAGGDVAMSFNGTNFLVVSDGAVGEFSFGSGPNFYSFGQNIDLLSNDLALTSQGSVQFFGADNTDEAIMEHDMTNLVIRSFIGTTNGLRLQGLNLYVQESAAAAADIVAYGQVWVRSDAPNTLMFTDDDGTDFVIGGALDPSYLNLQAAGTNRVLSTDAPGSVGDNIIIAGAGSGAANLADDIIVIGHGSFVTQADTDFGGSIVIGNRAWTLGTATPATSPSVVIGTEALENNSGQNSDNVVIGWRALNYAQLTGTVGASRNVIIGTEACLNVGDNTQSNAVIIGYQAARCNTFNNFVNANGLTAIGYRCMLNQQTGANNTGVGHDVMALGGGITGNQNTAVGQGALSNLTSGGRNTAVGQAAALGLGGGADNVYIGEGTGGTVGVGSNNTVIGQGAEGKTVQDNQIIIGHGAGKTATLPASDNIFVLEATPGTGVHILSFLYGELDVGNLLLGTAQSGPGAPINRDFGAGTPENVFKIHDTGSAPTGPATAGVTMFSDAGALSIIGGLNIHDDARTDTLNIIHDGTDGRIGTFTGDGNLDLYSTSSAVRVYHANGLRLQTLAAGTVAVVSDGNTDTEARRIQFTHLDGTLRSEVGHTGSAVFAVVNRIVSGNILLFGTNSGSASRSMIDCDPDGSVSIYQPAENAINFRTRASSVGGAQVANSFTGGGLERVLTDSDAHITATTTELADITDAINTSTSKEAGYMVFNTTSGAPVWAVGNTDGALWNDATGATAHTPV